MVKLTGEQRKAVILNAAVRLGRQRGIHNVTHGNVAKACSIQTSVHTVRSWYGTKQELWDAVIAHDETGELKKEAEALKL